MRPLPRKSGVSTSMRVFGDLARIAPMQSAKCWAPPSRRSSRSTLVTTTYFRPMSATVWARLAGSPASGGFGRPWATSQNEQRRVQTSPRIMNVAVPWLKHSWMFGQLASSQTVTRRFSRSLAFSVCTALPDGIRTRIHDGLRSTGASANCTGERPILSPPSCLTPACNGAADGVSPCTTCRGMMRAVVSVMALVGGAQAASVRSGRSVAGWRSNPNWRARWPSSTGLTAAMPDGPPKSTIEVTCSPW